MQLHRFDQVGSFWQVAQQYLLQHEAEHNALLGIVQTLLDYPERYPEPPYLAIVHTNDRIEAIAIQTPPNGLLLSKAVDLQAVKQIAEDLQQDPLPGVNGLVAETATFVQEWQRLTGQSYRQTLESRIYQLTQVNPVIVTCGSLRSATEQDRSLLLQWFAAFNSEIDILAEDEAERQVEVQLKRQSIYLWEDQVPVSMVGGRSFSPTSGRIAPVYTPSEHRRKGYATACVAAVSQKLLEQGCSRCFLFADLANLTSNAIYQKIGYRSICDWHEYSFISSKS